MNKLEKAAERLAVAAARTLENVDEIHRLRAALAEWYRVSGGERSRK